MRIVVAVVLSAFAFSAFAEDEAWQAPYDYAEELPEMVAPFEPFRVIGNIYYVGTEGLAVYLIAGDDGHALIDGGLPGFEHIIINNIAKLGFDIKDVKYLLNTHAHFDHSGGLAALKEASGAKLYASEGDVSALEGGFYLGFEDRTNFSAPPVSVDRAFPDDLILGPIAGTIFEGLHTPGHTRGCTSWGLKVEEAGEPYDVLVFCSASVGANRLVDPPQYEGIVEDYRYTFEETKDWKPDVFLANHPEVFHMKETREKQKAGDPLAFVNRGAFQAYRAEAFADFEEALEVQTRAADD